jgi:hypothetical protein
LVRRAVVLGSVGATLCGLACGLTADFSNLQGGHADLDGGHDGETGAQGSDGGFCASRKQRDPALKLCADFDTVATEDFLWSGKDLQNGGLTALSTEHFSAPKSFESELKAGGEGSARLKLGSPLRLSHVHAEFRLKLVPIDGDYELFGFHEDTSDGKSYGVFYKVKALMLGYEIRTPPACALPNPCWVDIVRVKPDWMGVEIDFDVSADANATLTIKHDGSVVVSHANKKTSSGSSTNTYFELGLYGFQPDAAKAYFDDVVIDWRE